MNITDKKLLGGKIKDRLKNLNKTQAYLSRIFQCTPQQITQALSGAQPTLLNKIENHLDILESRNNNE